MSQKQKPVYVGFLQLIKKMPLMIKWDLMYTIGEVMMSILFWIV